MPLETLPTSQRHLQSKASPVSHHIILSGCAGAGLGGVFEEPRVPPVDGGDPLGGPLSGAEHVTPVPADHHPDRLQVPGDGRGRAEVSQTEGRV